MTMETLNQIATVVFWVTLFSFFGFVACAFMEIYLFKVDHEMNDVEHPEIKYPGIKENKPKLRPMK